MAARRRARSRWALIALAVLVAGEALAEALATRDRELVAEVAWRLERDSAVPPEVPGSIARAALSSLGLSTTAASARTRTSLLPWLDRREIDANRAIEAMVRAADDPHTFVLARDVRIGLSQALQGRTHVQLGAVTIATTAGALVREIVPGCTADRMKVKAGDVIVSMDGVPYSRTEERAFFGRDSGAPVSLVLQRKKRQVVTGKAASCRPSAGHWTVRDSVALLRLRAMSVSDVLEHDAFATAASGWVELKQKGLGSLVVDLRGNRGGAEVEKVVALFTTAKTILVRRSREGDVQMERPHLVPPRLKHLRVAVLVDRSTGSAAEMVAFALQRHAGARVFGEPTIGAMSFPGGKLDLDADENRRLFYPHAVAVDPLTNEPIPGLRVTPDVLVPSPSIDDVRAGRDPALDAAAIWLNN